MYLENVVERAQLSCSSFRVVCKEWLVGTILPHGTRLFQTAPAGRRRDRLVASSISSTAIRPNLKVVRMRQVKGAT